MRFPIDEVRLQFPALEIQDAGVPRTYLDNPAGTQVPRRVADAVSRCLLESNANLGGYFVTSRAAERAAEDAHAAMARFLGAKSHREIVIGPSMTSLTFQLARSIGRTIERRDEIVVTHMDHDGNIAPWLSMAQDRGAEVRWVPFDSRTSKIEPQALADALNERTRLVALNYASNLTGSINDIHRLVERVHAAGALAYVDAVQFAPHGLIDVAAIGCDFLTCSSYKFYGPHMGIVWGKEDLLRELYPYKVRPQTDELPWRFETGTPQIEQLAGVNATVEYFEWLGGAVSKETDPRPRIRAAFDACASYERELTARLIAGLQRIPGVSIIGISEAARFTQRVPTVSFVHEKHSPIEIARALGERNVFVWSGHNFALEIVRSLGLDEEQGVVRIGIAHYNTVEEVDRCLEGVEVILSA